MEHITKGWRDAHASECSHEEDRAVILAVGDVGAWCNSGQRVAWRSNVVLAEFHEVTRDLLERIRPAMVVSPLLCRYFDCVDLAQVLGTLNYRGKYLALGSGLPNPGLIVREVRALVPRLDFEVSPSWV